MLMNTRGHIPPPAKTSLAARSQLDYSGHELLYATHGAQRVIADLRSRRYVSRLLLPHHRLGDAGCVTLFDYLTSDQGERPTISEIVLTANHIGNDGLLAIIGYLTNNKTLRKLSLQNNKFTASPSLTMSFVTALNSSTLESLYLSTNSGLGDAFIALFLPNLHTPTLTELSLSSMRLTPMSIPHILDFLALPPSRCRIDTFGCSANMLSTAGVRTILEAVEKHNYRLRRLDIFSNQGEDEDALRSEKSQNEWRLTNTILNRVLTRNSHLKHETEEQAFRLLRHARAVLVQLSRPTSSIPLARVLPTELKYHILSFFAPTLSSVQRLHIYAYVTSPTTLPPLLPRLPGLIRSSSDNSGSSELNTAARIEGCSVEFCTGLHRAIECKRERWLVLVGCESYVPGER